MDNHTCFEIDLKKLDNNIKCLKSILGDDTEICAVMKSDAYGCGIDICLPTIIDNGIKTIAISDNEEAKTLRDLGFDGSVLRLRVAQEDEINAALDLGIEELVGNLDYAKSINEIAKKNHTKISYHLALDSGQMGRNGVDMQDDNCYETIKSIINLPYLDLVGVMTHFSTNDNEKISQCLKDFKDSVTKLSEYAGISLGNIKLHTANSYTTLHVPSTRLDMVRVGDALYEDMGEDFPQFKDIFTLKTKVAAINEFKKGSPIGYGQTCKLTKNSKLAVLPIGFCNGYLKDFANRGRAMIKGHFVDVIGDISMNSCVVDITNYPDISVNDEVVLFGSQGDKAITQKDVKDITGMDIFEISTLWGKLNRRISI